MSTWYSNIITKTSSSISTLQRTLLSSEADGDTEDDTHVCRVLRNYYTEKGRPFPGWLPPDPKAPPPQQLPVYASQQQVGARYGQPAPTTQQGLSSLWNRGGDAAAQPAAQPTQSLRTAAAGGRMMNPYANNQNQETQQTLRPTQQRTQGSYQSSAGSSVYGRAMGTPPVAGGGGGGAQERWRQKILGGGSRSGSPSQGQGFAPPPPQQQQQQAQGSRFGSASSQGRGGGDYEERFAPGGMYDAAPPSGGGGRPGSLPSGPRRELPSGPRPGR